LAFRAASGQSSKSSGDLVDRLRPGLDGAERARAGRTVPMAERAHRSDRAGSQDLVADDRLALEQEPSRQWREAWPVADLDLPSLRVLAGRE